MKMTTNNGVQAGNNTSPNMIPSNTNSSITSKNSKSAPDPNDPFAIPSPGQGQCQGQCKGNGQGQGQGQQQKPETKTDFDFKDIEPGDIIQGTVRFSDTDSRQDSFEVHSTTKDRKIKFELPQPDGFKNVRFSRLGKDCVLIKMSKIPKSQRPDPEKMTPIKRIMFKKKIESEIAADIIARWEAGIRNFWLVGPAGSGKTTISKMVSDYLNAEFYMISCSIGTAAAKFEGYKYPTPRATKFASFYEDKSVILCDEFTALDPSVAQALNSALANDCMEITTETAKDGTDVIRRHEECLMICTSNTFGTGASPVYNANNQLDASTRDRFVGGVIEVDYSKDYESNFDKAVANFVWGVRECIKKNNLSRVASTRMIINGEKLKKYGFENWTAQLLADWSNKELMLLVDFFTHNKIPVKLNLGLPVDFPVGVDKKPEKRAT